MNSVLTAIYQIRKEKDLILGYTNNRYNVLIKEPDASKTAYYFGIPIYNAKTGNLVDLHFRHNKNDSIYVGSEVNVTVTDKVRLQNQYGSCEVLNLGSMMKRTSDTICFNGNERKIEVVPTLNGLMFKMEYDPISPPKLRIKLDRKFLSVRANEKYFSIMRERFVPFMTISCIGVPDSKGYIISPCETHHEKINDMEYDLVVLCEGMKSSWVAIEINLHENKLFQDTTVESNHPKVNNAFGGMAFLGNSRQCGEQWLYSRLGISNLPQLQNKKILKAVLHIPQLGKESSTLSIHRIAARFCSFGSNWQNKIAVTNPVAESVVANGYYHFDVTELFGDFKKYSENFVIRVKNKTDKPVMIPTGDNFYTPQILEVQYQ